MPTFGGKENYFYFLMSYSFMKRKKEHVLREKRLRLFFYTAIVSKYILFKREFHYLLRKTDGKAAPPPPYGQFAPFFQRIGRRACPGKLPRRNHRSFIPVFCTVFLILSSICLMKMASKSEQAFLSLSSLEVSTPRREFWFLYCVITMAEISIASLSLKPVGYAEHGVRGLDRL